ncbi:hypothetical protein [Amycolatopsis rubida]|uniref:hypothetical protein n=1 Tax=Amycolatopsis rubida TaxID=112413 RepID=UPI000B8269AD|nr:hypothetical protein [Amycolatopsis rubida]
MGEFVEVNQQMVGVEDAKLGDLGRVRHAAQQRGDRVLQSFVPGQEDLDARRRCFGQLPQVADVLA